jgi:inositol oxygenase
MSKQGDEDQTFACSTSPQSSIVKATIHVLSVKEDYRGFDFGGLLFCEAVDCLKRNCGASETVCCSFVAKEDTMRYGKLIAFYEELGAVAKKPCNAFLSGDNDDGQTYRRVPMQLMVDRCGLVNRAVAAFEESLAPESNELQRYTSFLPLKLCKRTVSGEGFIPLHYNGKMSWLMIELTSGELIIQATRDISLAFSLELSKVRAEQEDQTSTCVGDNLWTLKSKETGMYLNVDSQGNNLTFSKLSCFWETARTQKFCLILSDFNLEKKRFHRQFWKMQTLDFVREMRLRYCRFNVCRISIKDALDLASGIPLDPFSSGSPSTRTLLFATAELAKYEGNPDWVQFVGLVYGLACVLKTFDSAAFREINLDWTVSDMMGRAVGGKTDTAVSPRLEPLYSNSDQDKRHYSQNVTSARNCGMENVLLSWTSNEYMYHMLKRNNVGLPAEAFKLLKLGPLVDWHKHGKHQEFSDDSDEQAKQSVADFHSLCYRARRILVKSGKDMSDNDCDALWQSHYSFVVRKYTGTQGKFYW